MNYKKILENNSPLLTFETFSFLKRFSKSVKLFLFLLILASFLIILAICYMIFEDKKNINKILLARESTLNTEITRLENKNDILEAEILLLKNEVKSLSRKKDQKKLNRITKYLADSEISGKGIIITLNENNSNNSPFLDESSIIHNTDLLKIVNFLWKENATAVSINDERIVQNSHISCVGPTILINKKRINSPFVIKAVGEKFDENTVKNDAIMLSLELRGIEVEIKKNDNIQIPPGRYATFRE